MILNTYPAINIAQLHQNGRVMLKISKLSVAFCLAALLIGAVDAKGGGRGGGGGGRGGGGSRGGSRGGGGFRK